MTKENEVKTAWIDTNIIIYYLRHNKDFSPKVIALIEAAKRGEYILKVSPMIISECVFVLMGKDFRATKEQIKTALLSFINMEGIEMEEHKVIEEALTNFAKKGIDFVDAYIAAHAKHTLPAHVITQNIKDFKGLNIYVEVVPEGSEEKQVHKR